MKKYCMNCGAIGIEQISETMERCEACGWTREIEQWKPKEEKEEKDI